MRSSIWIWASVLIAIGHAVSLRMCRSSSDALEPVPSSSQRRSLRVDDCRRPRQALAETDCQLDGLDGVLLRFKAPARPNPIQSGASGSCTTCDALEPFLRGLYHELFHSRRAGPGEGRERPDFHKSAAELLAILGSHEGGRFFRHDPAEEEVVRVYDCMMRRFPFVFDLDGRIDALFEGCNGHIKGLLDGLRLADMDANETVLFSDSTVQSRRLNRILNLAVNRVLPPDFLELPNEDATPDRIVAFLKRKGKQRLLLKRRVLLPLLYCGIRFSVAYSITQIGFCPERFPEIYPFLYLVQPNANVTALRELLPCICASMTVAKALLRVPEILDVIRADPIQFLYCCVEKGAPLVRRVARADKNFVREAFCTRFGDDSETVLHHACRTADISLTAAFLDNEGDAKLRNKDGDVAISLLPEKAIKDLLRELKVPNIRALIESAPAKFLRRYANSKGIVVDAELRKRFRTASESDIGRLLVLIYNDTSEALESCSLFDETN